MKFLTEGVISLAEASAWASGVLSLEFASESSIGDTFDLYSTVPVDESNALGSPETCR